MTRKLGTGRSKFENRNWENHNQETGNRELEGRNQPCHFSVSIFEFRVSSFDFPVSALCRLPATSRDAFQGLRRLGRGFDSAAPQGWPNQPRLAAAEGKAAVVIKVPSLK
jgi:hypothetical protein